MVRDVLSGVSKTHGWILIVVWVHSPAMGTGCAQEEEGDSSCLFLSFEPLHT